MLKTIGEGSRGNLTLGDRLLDCHARIRHFGALAVRLSDGGKEDEVRHAARELERYFRVALPLHVEDEEQSLQPRLLRLADAHVSAALATMKHEHAEVEALLSELMTAWRAIAEQPTLDRCQATRAAALALREHFDRHLTAEEEMLFPQLDNLPANEVEAIIGEMQTRRGPR